MYSVAFSKALNFSNCVLKWGCPSITLNSLEVLTFNSSEPEILVNRIFAASQVSDLFRLCNRIASTPSKTISLNGPEYEKFDVGCVLLSGDSLHARIQSCSCGPSMYFALPGTRRRYGLTFGTRPEPAGTEARAVTHQGIFRANKEASAQFIRHQVFTVRHKVGKVRQETAVVPVNLHGRHMDFGRLLSRRK